MVVPVGGVSVGGSAGWEICQLGEVPVGGAYLSDFLDTIFFLIHFYLINAINEHFSNMKFIK